VPGLPGPDDHLAADLVAVDLQHADGLRTPEVAAIARRLRDGDLVAVGCAPTGIAGVPAAILDALACTLTPDGVDAATSRSQRVVTVRDPEAALDQLGTRVRQNPGAVTVLTQLLPVTARCAVRRGLLLESMAYSTLLAGGEFSAWLAERPPRRPADPARCVVSGFRTGPLLHLTLDDPGRRNAYGAAMREGLLELLDVALADPGVRRVVLDGAGPSFCSGGDLSEFGTGPGGCSAHLLRTRRSPAAVLHRLSARVEARVHGACVGAGIELPAFAGRIVAAPGTTFRLPEIGMGLIPGAGGTVGITRRVGRWRTWFMAVDGGPVDVTTAHGWGLVDEVTGPRAIS
jgi:Enoyl-CoA hydratase/isomerase